MKPSIRSTPARFDVSKRDAELINAIVDRAFRDYDGRNERTRRVNCSMDITAAHRNGNALDLVRFLGADDFNFWHDLNGIARHIDRNTGELLNCFVPRFSLPKKKARGRTSRSDTRYIASASAERGR